MIKYLLAAAAALALAAPLAAQAQEVPSYAAVQGDQQIHGRITSFDGAYNLQVRDDNGYVDNVELHDGTIINPTGLTLAAGMVVSILGDNAGPDFQANEVDTPYEIENDVPYYSGHPWSYYGPSVNLSFFFGNTGWWQGPAVRRGYDRTAIYVGGSRTNRVIVNNYTTNNPRVNRNAPDRPSAPNNRPAAPNNSPVAPNNRPVAPNDRPTVPNNRPTVPNNRPGAPNQRPGAPNERPSAPRADNGNARGGQHSAAAPSRESGSRERR